MLSSMDARRKVCLVVISTLESAEVLPLGKIMRMTIPRSQGKQPYYDARKSSWGDIFPHKPKNPPQIRLVPKDKADGASSLPGSDIGKRRRKEKTQDTTSYGKIMADLKEKEKERRREWAKFTDSLDEL